MIELITPEGQTLWAGIHHECLESEMTEDALVCLSHRTSCAIYPQKPTVAGLLSDLGVLGEEDDALPPDITFPLPLARTAAYCNTKDNFSRSRGRHIALGRACATLGYKLKVEYPAIVHKDTVSGLTFRRRGAPQYKLSVRHKGPLTNLRLVPQAHRSAEWALQSQTSEE